MINGQGHQEGSIKDKVGKEGRYGGMEGRLEILTPNRTRRQNDHEFTKHVQRTLKCV